MDKKKKMKIKDKKNKKWTPEEVGKLLEYIQRERRDFEKPTAQFYYKKCIGETKIDATWDLMRFKVRHLKIGFKKAEDWRKSTEAVLLESDQGISAVKEKLQKMCPQYDILEDIFGEKYCEPSYNIYDTETKFVPEENVNLFCSQSLYVEESSTDNSGSQVITLEMPDAGPSHATSMTSSVTTGNSRQVRRVAEKLKKNSHKNAIDQLTIIQSERNEMIKLKIEFEKEKLLKKSQFNEKKLLLQELKIKEEIERNKEENERRKEEIALRTLEMEKDERLRTLEIEKQERIAKYEIEMKYTYGK